MEDTELSNTLLSQDEQMELAVAYKNQNPLISNRKIAYLYGVSRSTLGHRLNRCRDPKTYYQDHQQLTVLEEASLIKWMTQLMNWGWPPCISQLNQMAMHLLICKGDHKPPGQHCYGAFLT